MAITPKLSTIYLTLAIVVLGTSATLMMTAMTSTTAAFAQSNNNNAKGPCPEGYTISKGQCVGPATTTTTETKVCPERGPNNDVVALVIGADGKEYCSIGTVESLHGYGNPTCPDPRNQVLNPDGFVSCYVIIPFITTTTTTTTCEPANAVLNTDTNTCTIKPGNRGGAAA